MDITGKEIHDAFTQQKISFVCGICNEEEIYSKDSFYITQEGFVIYLCKSCKILAGYNNCRLIKFIGE